MNNNPSSSCLRLSLQDSDNPDLRDRGYIYWRLLSTDPVAAKEVVLAEKPLISEETDLIEPTLLEELICHLVLWPLCTTSLPVPLSRAAAVFSTRDSQAVLDRE